MAYNKKYATLGESVIDYVNDREDRIGDAIDGVVIGDNSYTKLESGMSIERKLVPIVANQTWNGTVTFQNCLEIPTVLITFSEPYTTYYQGKLHIGQATNNSVVVNLSELPGAPVEFWLNVIVVGKWK